MIRKFIIFALCSFNSDCFDSKIYPNLKIKISGAHFDYLDKLDSMIGKFVILRPCSFDSNCFDLKIYFNLKFRISGPHSNFSLNKKGPK